VAFFFDVNRQVDTLRHIEYWERVYQGCALVHVRCLYHDYLLVTLPPRPTYLFIEFQYLSTSKLRWFQ